MSPIGPSRSHGASRSARWLAAASFAAAVVVGGTTADAQSAAAMLRYENGSRLYGMQRFVEAAHEFEAAYTLSLQAELLFNLGRAWEDARETARALDAYLRFEAAGAPGYDLTQLRARIARLRGALSAAQAQVVVAAPPVVRPPPRRPAAPGPPVGPIVLMSVGGAALVAVIPLWASARATYADLDAVCPSRACSTVFERDAARGGRFALAGDVLLGVGLASAGAGLTWLLLGRAGSAAADGRRVTLECSPGACVLGMTGTF